MDNLQNRPPGKVVSDEELIDALIAISVVANGWLRSSGGDRKKK